MCSGVSAAKPTNENPALCIRSLGIAGGAWHSTEMTGIELEGTVTTHKQSYASAGVSSCNCCKHDIVRGTCKGWFSVFSGSLPSAGCATLMSNAVTSKCIHNSYSIVDTKTLTHELCTGAFGPKQKHLSALAIDTSAVALFAPSRYYLETQALVYLLYSCWIAMNARGNWSFRC